MDNKWWEDVAAEHARAVQAANAFRSAQLDLVECDLDSAENQVITHAELLTKIYLKEDANLSHAAPVTIAKTIVAKWDDAMATNRPEMALAKALADRVLDQDAVIYSR